MAADLARRDFTVNSFALNLQDLEVVDPFSGLDDLARAPVARHHRELLHRRPSPGVAAGAIRWPARPTFRLSPQTLELALRAVPQLENVAPERIREELRLLFSHDGGDESFRLLERLGVYPTLWTGQSAAFEDSTAAGASLDRFGRASRWLEQMAPESPFHQDPFTGRMAVLFDTASRERAPQRGRPAAGVSDGRLHRGNATPNGSSACCAGRILPMDEGPQRWLLHEMAELWLSDSGVLSRDPG